MYHIVTDGYQGKGFRASVIVSKLCYIAIIKHVLQSVHCYGANMNICTFVE